MNVSIYFKWFDFWVGWFWERRSRSLYICPLPMVGIKLCFCKHDQMLFVRNVHGDEIIHRSCRSLFWCPECDMVIGSQKLVYADVPEHERMVLNVRGAKVAATALLAQLQGLDWDKLQPHQAQMIHEMAVRFRTELPVSNPMLRNSLNALMSVKEV